MGKGPQGEIIFDLLESSGIALAGLDAGGRIVRANPNLGLYLDVDAGELVGREASAALRPLIRSEEFWSGFPATSYALVPGPRCLLLVVTRGLRGRGTDGLRRAVILRPYSLEREYGRMRVCLNSHLAREIAAHLNSVGIASELITDPELRESRQSRAAFLSTFHHDVSDLNTLFVQLLETAEPLALPNRIAPARLDWKALVEDLAAKLRGLASERGVALALALPPRLPSPSGDYHWLYLGLYGVFAHVLRTAPPLGEVALSARARRGRLESILTAPSEERPAPWPPPARFALEEAHPRIGRLQVSELAVMRAIFLLHGGDVERREAGGRVTYTASLPA